MARGLGCGTVHLDHRDEDRLDVAGLDLFSVRATVEVRAWLTDEVTAGGEW